MRQYLVKKDLLVETEENKESIKNKSVHKLSTSQSNGHGTDQCQNQNDSQKWFHISDSSISEATLDEVLAANAYILFYRRV